MHPLEKFYPLVPVWAQNLGISLYGLAWRRERLGGAFDKYVDEFRKREQWNSAQMRNYCAGRLKTVLCRAFDFVPYYQRAWSAAGIKRDDFTHLTLDFLQHLPIMPKAELRANPMDFVARDIPEGQLHKYYSSGSTGTPITAICTPDDHRRFIAAREIRSFGWAGCSIADPRSMIGGRLVVPKGVAKPPFYRYNFAEHQVYFSAYHIAPAHVTDYVGGFNRHHPKLLTGYANSYYLLGRMMLEQKLRLDYQPAAAVLCSEKLTASMKSVIREAFGARAFEEYGAVENCMLATECEKGNLHVSPDFGILEIVDEKGMPVPAGVEGRVLCTGLVNNTQLLIRYEIGDLASWSKEPCSCGRNHLPVLKEVVGRLEDVVTGPDGRQMVRFHGIFVDMPNVVEGQVIQESLDEFTVKVVAGPSFGADDELEIRRRFAERLGPVRVGIDRVQSIPRTERGKFRAVISRIAPANSRHSTAQSVVQVTCQKVLPHD